MKLGKIDLNKAKFECPLRNAWIEVSISEGEESTKVTFYDNEILSALAFALRNGWMPDVGIRIVS